MALKSNYLTCIYFIYLTTYVNRGFYMLDFSTFPLDRNSSYCDSLGLQPIGPQITPLFTSGPSVSAFNYAQPQSNFSQMLDMLLLLHLMKNHDRTPQRQPLQYTGNQALSSSITIPTVAPATTPTPTPAAPAITTPSVPKAPATKPSTSTATPKPEETKKAEEDKKAEEEEKKEAAKKLEEAQTKAEKEYTETKEHQGWLGKTWDSMKNNLGASSEKVKTEEIEGKTGVGHWFRKQWSKVIDSDNGTGSLDKKMAESREKIEEAKKDPTKLEEAYTQTNGEIDKAEDIFIKGKNDEDLTSEEKKVYDAVKDKLGDKSKDITRDDLRKKIQEVLNEGYEKPVAKQILEKAAASKEEGGLQLNTATAAKTFKSSQEAGVDTIASVTNGLIIATGVALSPLSFGWSLAIAIPAGAGVKVLMKSTDAASGGRDYDTFGKDLLTGSVDGALACIFPGGSSAATTTAAKALGLQAVKTTTKEIAEEATVTIGKEVVKASSEQAVKASAEQVVAQNASKGLVSRLFNPLSKSSETAVASETGIVTRTGTKLSLTGKKQVSEEIGQIVEEGSKVIAKDTNGKILATFERIPGKDGKTILQTTEHGVSSKVVSEVTSRATTKQAERQGIKETIEYTTKESTGITSRIGNAIDSTGKGRTVLARTAGTAWAGGNAGAIAAGADSIARGDDLATVAQNAERGFKAGALLGGATAIGSSAVRGLKGAGSKVATSVEAKTTAEAAAAKEAHVKTLQGKLEEAKKLLPSAKGKERIEIEEAINRYNKELEIATVETKTTSYGDSIEERSTTPQSLEEMAESPASSKNAAIKTEKAVETTASTTKKTRQVYPTSDGRYYYRSDNNTVIPLESMPTDPAHLEELISKNVAKAPNTNTVSIPLDTLSSKPIQPTN